MREDEFIKNLIITDTEVLRDREELRCYKAALAAVSQIDVVKLTEAINHMQCRFVDTCDTVIDNILEDPDTEEYTTTNVSAMLNHIVRVAIERWMSQWVADGGEPSHNTEFINGGIIATVTKDGFNLSFMPIDVFIFNGEV